MRAIFDQLQGNVDSIWNWQVAAPMHMMHHAVVNVVAVEKRAHRGSAIGGVLNVDGCRRFASSAIARFDRVPAASAAHPSSCAQEMRWGQMYTHYTVDGIA